MKKIVLTGAAGRLGSYLREPLSKLATNLLSTDIADDIGTLYPGESYVPADLADFAAIRALMEGADMVVHFGAIADEAPFERILGPNIIGSYNIWESAWQAGVRRIVYASSIHAVGMHDKTSFIDADVAHLPDTFYGLSKCFTEDLGRLYFEKRRLESVLIRILSCTTVSNARALGSWLSYDDLIQLVTRAIDTPTVGCTIVYGVSNNDRTPVDNARAQHLGYRPKDNAEQYGAEILAAEPAASPTDIALTKQGGPFAATNLGESGVALMKFAADDKP